MPIGRQIAASGPARGLDLAMFLLAFVSGCQTAANQALWPTPHRAQCCRCVAPMPKRTMLLKNHFDRRSLSLEPDFGHALTNAPSKKSDVPFEAVLLQR